MKNNLHNERVETIIRAKHRRYIYARVTIVLMCITVFVTTFLLMSPALTLDTNALDIASGTSGGVDWRITAEGELILSPNPSGNGLIPSSRGWDGYRSRVTSVTVNPGVKAPTYSQSLFGAYTNAVSFDVKNLDVSGCINMTSMFYNCPSAVTIDMTGWNTSSATSTDFMFNGCNSLKNIPGVTGFNMSHVATAESMFYGCESLEHINVDGWDLSACTNLSNIFYDSGLKEIDFSHVRNTNRITNFSGMFEGCFDLESAVLPNLVSSSATNVSKMFRNCASLSQLDASGWDTSHVTNMSNFLDSTEALTECPDVESFNTAAVTNFYYMFNGSGIERLDLSDWNTSNATNMGGMFYNCVSLTELDVSNFDTSHVTSMTWMFAWCNSLQSLDLSSFRSDALTTTASMFQRSGALKEITFSPAFTCANATSLSQMFLSCTSLTDLDVSHFCPTASSYSSMFSGCSALENVDVSNFRFAPSATIQNMFNGCQSLEYLDLSAWDTSNVTNMALAFIGIGTTTEESAVITLGPDFIIPDGKSPFYYVNPYNSQVTEAFYMKQNPDGTLDTSVRDKDGIAAYQSTSTQNTDYVRYYCISYDANGGHFPDGTTSKEYYYKAGTFWDKELCPDPSNTGFDFIGWDTICGAPSTRVNDDDLNVESRIGQYGGVYDSPAISFYAEWTDHSFTVNSSDHPLGYIIATGDNNGNPLPSKTFHVNLNCMEAYGPQNITGTVVSAGSGKYAIDFGNLEFNYPGVYHFELLPDDPAEDGWVINKAPKIVRVEILEESSGILSLGSITPVEFTNVFSHGKNTEELTPADKKNNQQSNYTVREEQDTILKGVEWTDKKAGEAEIHLNYNNSYGASTETRAVYLFCNCTAHGFSREMALDNIKFLLDHYTYVDVIALEDQYHSTGFTKKFASFTEYSTESDISAFLDMVKYVEGAHNGAMYTINVMTEYFKKFTPTAVYLSFDGTRSFGADGDPYGYTYSMYMDCFNLDGFDYRENAYFSYTDEQMETIRKLAKYQEDGLYYLMTASQEDETYTYLSIMPNKAADSKYNIAYRNILYNTFATISPAVFADPDGYNEILSLIDDVVDNRQSVRWVDWLASKSTTYANKVYEYEQSFEAVGIDLPLSRKFSIIDTIDSAWTITGTTALDGIKVGFYSVDGSGNIVWTDYDPAEYILTLDTDESGHTKVTVSFPAMNLQVPVSIRIPVKTTLKEYTSSEDWFKATNIGDAYADVMWEYINSATGEHSTASATSTRTTSPVLYKTVLHADVLISKKNDFGDVLPDVQFALYTSLSKNAPEGAETVEYNGSVYYKVGVYTTNTAGHINLSDLDTTATYLLKEISTPAEYQLINDFIHIGFDNDGDSVLQNSLSCVSLKDDNEIEIINYPMVELPETGGNGIGMFTTISVTCFTVALLLCGVMICLKKRGSQINE